jgi:hypothetical protein
MGCNKCKKEFPGMIGERNYGGFDRSAFEYIEIKFPRF